MVSWASYSRRVWVSLRREPIGMASLAIAATGILFAWAGFSQQGEHHAWNTVAQHAPGNSGVGQAMEHLHQTGELLQNIDLRPISEAFADEDGLDEVHLTFVQGVELDEIDMRRAWLSYTDFSNSTLTNATLIEVQWDHSKLNSVDFTGTRLDNAIFASTSLIDTVFSDTYLPGADFREALLTVKGNNVHAQGANFSDATIIQTQLEGLIASNSNFFGASVIDSELLHADFSHAEMNRVRFVNSTLQDANFSNSQLYEASFYGSNLSGVDFSEAEGIESVHWVGSWAWDDMRPMFDSENRPSDIRLYNRTCVENGGSHATQLYELRPDNQDCLVSWAEAMNHLIQ